MAMILACDLHDKIASSLDRLAEVGQLTDRDDQARRIAFYYQHRRSGHPVLAGGDNGDGRHQPAPKLADAVTRLAGRQEWVLAVDRHRVEVRGTSNECR